MLLRKYSITVLLIIFYSLNNPIFATQQPQNTPQTLNKEEFKASLKKLPPKEFARLFTQQYKQDSIKVIQCLQYVQDEMLYSKDVHAQFWGYYALANSQNDVLNLEGAIQSLDQAFQIATSLNNNELKITALINKGNYYFDFGEYEEAMIDYLKVLDLAKKTKNKEREEAVSLNIALIKMQTNDFIGANAILNKLLASIKKQEPKIRHLNIYIALTKGCIGIEDYTQAKYYCQKGLRLSEELNYSEAKFYFYSFLGRIAYLKNDLSASHEFIEKSLQIAEKTKTLDHETPILFIEKGEVFYKEKRYEDAIKILCKADTLMQKYKLDFIKLEEAYALLAKSYREINDFENSLKYYAKANEIYKLNDKRQGNISAGIISKYDLKSIKDELIAAKEASRKNKKNLMLSLALGISLIAGLVFFYRKREQNNQQKFEVLLKNIEDEKVRELESETKENQADKIEEVATKEIEIIDETKMKLLKKLQNFEAKEQFLSKNCSLNDVAKKLKTNTSYLSKIVNSHKGKSFSTYITDLRVNYAIKRLKNDTKFRSYTIDSIAQEIGFNRSESFSRAFKNKTGLYPSYYIKKLDSQDVV